MLLDSRKYLHDIQLAADRVARFSSGRTFEQYQTDELTRSAVERQLEIIGEALTQLSKIEPQVAAAIPDHGKIIAFRNILIHGYATVDDRIVWGVIELHLNTLRTSGAQPLASA